MHETFVRAFADYALDMSYLSETHLYNRAVKNGVDFAQSVGAFDDERMVGFTLIGTDHWYGAPSAFDIATGIVEPYRGKGLATRMLDYAIERLRAKGIKRVVLEVLQENGPAIAAYQKANFEINREIDCFELEPADLRIRSPETESVRIEYGQRVEVAEFAGAFDWEPSWENSLASIGRIPDEVVVLVASFEGKRAGVMAYYPALGWILTLAVIPDCRRQGVATALICRLAEEIGEGVSSIKLLNVPREDRGMTSFLEAAGFRAFTRQFEMWRLI